jgi:hypothetical protein
VQHEAGVPWVVCWSTACDDEAAREFSVHFFKYLSRQGSEAMKYRDAFRAATIHVKGITHLGKLDDGTEAEVPKFVFRDPASQAQAATRRDVDRAPMAGSQQQEATTHMHERISAGIGLLLCPRQEGKTAYTTDY